MGRPSPEIRTSADRATARQVAATVVVTVEHQKLVSRSGAAGMDTGSAMSIGQVRRLACEAGILPAVLDGDSVPLDLGRTKRHFQESQPSPWPAYHECAAADCDRPYAWCDLHHEAHGHGGRTDPADAVPCAGSTIACMARGTRRASTGGKPQGRHLPATALDVPGQASCGEGTGGRGRIGGRGAHWWTWARYLRNLLVRRSAKGLPPVWQVAQYRREESAKDTSRTMSPHPGRTPVRPMDAHARALGVLSSAAGFA